MKGVAAVGRDRCLSAWAAASLAGGWLATEKAAAARRHLETCRSCQELVEDETTAVERAAEEPLPIAVARYGGGGPWLRKAAAGAAALAACAALFTLRPPSEPLVRTKGAGEVVVALARGGRTLAAGVPLESVQPLQEGDRLRLRVPGTAGWVSLEDWTGRHWRSYYEGPVPQDGWLPVGVRITEGEARLRVRICPGELGMADDCEIHVLPLR